MWQRFTERARRVVFFAQEEAGRLGENYISTEHLLLGIVREADSVASRLLDRMGVPVGRVRSEIERQVMRGDGRMGQDMQLTPRAKTVIDLAYDEARLLNNNYIGTEHLLLGLIREGEGLAGRILNKLGVDLERTRREVMQLQDAGDGWEANEATPGTHEASPSPENLHGGRMQHLRSIFRMLLRRDPELAKMPPEDVVRALMVREGEGSDTEAAATERVKPKVGDLGVLKSVDGRAVVEVAVDVAAFLRLLTVFEARDAFGYRELAGEKQFFIVPAGTSVKYLKTPHDDRAIAFRAENGCRVRLMEGEHTGRAGYIAANEFERTGPDESPFPPLLTDAGRGGETGPLPS